jgi:hypothetical protein
VHEEDILNRHYPPPGSRDIEVFPGAVAIDGRQPGTAIESGSRKVWLA